MDLYKILEVSKDDSCEDIKIKCRDNLKRLHPDHGGNNDNYIKFLQAYQILIDIERRKLYDTTGKIDDINSNLIKNTIISMFDQIISDYINNDHCILNDDIFNILTNVIKSQKQNYENQLKLIPNKLSKIDTLLNKLKSETSIYFEILNNKKDQFNKSIDHINLEICNLNQMLDFIKDSSLDTRQQMIQYTFCSPLTTSTN